MRMVVEMRSRAAASAEERRACAARERRAKGDGIASFF
jgi:hypothetical protein